MAAPSKDTQVSTNTPVQVVVVDDPQAKDGPALIGVLLRMPAFAVAGELLLNYLDDNPDVANESNETQKAHKLLQTKSWQQGVTFWNEKARPKGRPFFRVWPALVDRLNH